MRARVLVLLLAQTRSSVMAAQSAADAALQGGAGAEIVSPSSTHGTRSTLTLGSIVDASGGRLVIRAGADQVQRANTALQELQDCAGDLPPTELAGLLCSLVGTREAPQSSPDCGDALHCSTTSKGWLRRGLQCAVAAAHVAAGAAREEQEHPWHSILSRYDLRVATAHDMEGVLCLVQELAEFEREPEAVKVTREVLQRDGFPKDTDPLFYVCLLHQPGEAVPAGMAFLYVNYSTWTGKCMYLEDLYIRPAHRRGGLGTFLIDVLATAASVTGCARLSWQVLDWNTPAVACYDALGAANEKEWLNYRLHADGIEKRAQAGLRGKKIPHASPAPVRK